MSKSQSNLDLPSSEFDPNEDVLSWPSPPEVESRYNASITEDVRGARSWVLVRIMKRIQRRAELVKDVLTTKTTKTLGKVNTMVGMTASLNPSKMKPLKGGMAATMRASQLAEGSEESPRKLEFRPILVTSSLAKGSEGVESQLETMEATRHAGPLAEASEGVESQLETMEATMHTSPLAESSEEVESQLTKFEAMEAALKRLDDFAQSTSRNQHNKHSSTFTTSSSQNKSAPSPNPQPPTASQCNPWMSQPAKYICKVVHECRPPALVSYNSLPFFTLRIGEVYGILQEAGHPSIHPGLPLYIDDDGEDCLLLCRDENDLVGWALASFLMLLSSGS